MAALPHMQFYPSDYLADTPHLSTVEHGAYLLLIFAYWTKGEPLPDSDARLARITKMSDAEWLAVRDTLTEFFVIENGVWTHNRIDIELEKARTRVDQAKNAGTASAERRSNARSTPVKRALNGKANGSATIQNQNQNTPKGVYTPQPPNGVSQETWDDFIEVRKQHRAPLTKGAMKLIEKAIVESSGSPDETVGQSVLNGWRGVFPLKRGAGNGKRSGWIER